MVHKGLDQCPTIGLNDSRVFAGPARPFSRGSLPTDALNPAASWWSPSIYRYYHRPCQNWKKKQWSRYGGVDRLYFLEYIRSRVNSNLFLESPRGADAPSHWRQSWPRGEAVRYGGCFPTVGSKGKGRFGVQSQQSCIYWLGSNWRGMSYIWVIFLPSEIELNSSGKPGNSLSEKNWSKSPYYWPTTTIPRTQFQNPSFYRFLPETQMVIRVNIRSVMYTRYNAEKLLTYWYRNEVVFHYMHEVIYIHTIVHTALLSRVARNTADCEEESMYSKQCELTCIVQYVASNNCQFKLGTDKKTEHSWLHSDHGLITTSHRYSQY